MIKPLKFATLAVLIAGACTAAGFALPPSSFEALLNAAPGVELSFPLPGAHRAAAPAGEQLFQQLHQQTAMPGVPGGHAYLDAKKFMFSKADNTGCGGGPGVTCLYSQVCVKGASGSGADYRELSDLNGDGVVDNQGMNAEHSWPQGFFNEAYPMKSDLHHIFPTFVTPNSTRGSFPFSKVSGASYSTNSGSRLGAEGFEPADAAKGDIARAILYFVVRYYDVNIRDGVNYNAFWTSRVPMFLEWDRQDPPDAAEKRRNDLIYQYQGNRNPFVDDTTLAGKIGLKVFQAH
ncbi:MAG TPA: endonuclease [Elusimicrobiales bacterium]|nr:endonuclease [Elusimicrobiales bacterium]